MINGDMYRNLSSLFYELDLANESEFSQFRKKLKMYYESLVEQVYSHIYQKQYRNLATTLRNINSSEKITNSALNEVIDALRLSLSAPYPLSSKIYTDDNDDIIEFVVSYMIPFVISLINSDSTDFDGRAPLKVLLIRIQEKWS